MSGGHFDFSQYHIERIADELEAIIERNKSVETDKYDDPIGMGFSDDVVCKLRDGVRILREAHIYATRIDWLVSGDDGEQPFLDRLNEELNAFRGRQ